MARWWRRIKISAVFHVFSRRDSRSHPAPRVINRKTNLRHMMVDHHGRSARWATLLVRAVDGILGTHTFPVLGFRVLSRPRVSDTGEGHRHRRVMQRADPELTYRLIAV